VSLKRLHDGKPLQPKLETDAAASEKNYLYACGCEDYCENAIRDPLK
jgi:hypothetical protein